MPPQKPSEDRSHHLLVIKEVPESLYVMRRMLLEPQHADIKAEAMKAATFEESIGIIAAMLDIALDGDYEPDPLFTMLCEALRNRGSFKSQPHLRAAGLVNAELVERDGDVTLERKVDAEGPYIEGTGMVEPVQDAIRGNEDNTNVSSTTRGESVSSIEVGDDLVGRELEEESQHGNRKSIRSYIEGSAASEVLVDESDDVHADNSASTTSELDE